MKHRLAGALQGRQLRTIRAKHEWESMLDVLPQLICLIDTGGNVLRANRTLETWGLGRVTEIKDTQVHDMLHPGCGDGGCSLLAKWTGLWLQFRDRGYAECEYRDAPSGRDLRLLLSTGEKSHYSDATGPEGCALLVVEDVTRQVQAEHILQNYNAELENLVQERTRQLALANARLRDEVRMHLRDRQALADAQKKYSCILETTLTGYYVIQEGRITFCNRRFAEIFGYTRKEVYRLEMQRLFPPGMTSDTPAPPPGETGEAHIAQGRNRDGGTLWLRRSLASLDCLSEAMTLGNIVDVTEQRNAEIALDCLQCDKKVLSEKLLIAQESERKQISAELHDSIGQSMSAIKFGVENALHDHGMVMPKSVRTCLVTTIGKLCQTIDEIRRISMNLRPSMLDDLGLLATISWFCREFRVLFPKLDIDVHIGVEESGIPTPLKVVIFRILQESMNNVGKHARATRVTLRLARRDDRIVFEVADNGRGFATNGISTGQGFGLGSMRERVSLSGGRLTIDSDRGTGTVICADWPSGN